jgi:hypothetical protein
MKDGRGIEMDDSTCPRCGFDVYRAPEANPGLQKINRVVKNFQWWKDLYQVEPKLAETVRESINGITKSLETAVSNYCDIIIDALESKLCNFNDRLHIIEKKCGLRDELLKRVDGLILDDNWRLNEKKIHVIDRTNEVRDRTQGDDQTVLPGN